MLVACSVTSPPVRHAGVRLLDSPICPGSAGPGGARGIHWLVPVARGVPHLGGTGLPRARCDTGPDPAVNGHRPEGAWLPPGYGACLHSQYFVIFQCHIPLPPFPPLSQPFGSRWSEFLGVWAGLTFLSTSLCPNLQKIVAFFFFFSSPLSFFLSLFLCFLGSSALLHACAGT